MLCNGSPNLKQGTAGVCSWLKASESDCLHCPSVYAAMAISSSTPGSVSGLGSWLSTQVQPSVPASDCLWGPWSHSCLRHSSAERRYLNTHIDRHECTLALCDQSQKVFAKPQVSVDEPIIGPFGLHLKDNFGHFLPFGVPCPVGQLWLLVHYSLFYSCQSVLSHFLTVLDDFR